MSNHRQQFGTAAESIAASHLMKLGYQILEKNYRTKFGEIDLIAKDKDTIVFVEVKARNTGTFGHPKGAVTYRKQHKISMAALKYLQTTRRMGASARFDVVAICSDNGAATVEIVKNAFELICE